MKVVFGDLEANGLLQEATKVHCGVFKEMGGKVVKFRPSQVEEMLRYLDTVDVLIMHNGIGYDKPLLEKLYKYTFKGKLVDTLIMSRLLNPKRIIPFNCLNKKAGPHSIEAWGYRVGRGKPEHNDWENFSEAMLYRCSEDVEILALVYEELLKEAGKDKWKPAFQLNFELFAWLQKQEEYGWLVDQDRMHLYIRQLDRIINWIDGVITPQLPKVLEIEEHKVKGEYTYIRKPFLKSGAYSQAVVDWYTRCNYPVNSDFVSGPFSRVYFRPTNLNSNDETKQFLLGAGWEPLEWNENDDGDRTSPKLSKDDPFEGIEGRVGRYVARRVQCRQRKSIITGLFDLIRPDGRIPSVINNLAVTGRATHRNIVNIPKAGSFWGKQMRRIFTSSEGKILVGTDSAGNQLRQLAARMGSQAYIDAMINGRKEDGTDAHSITKRVGDLESRDVAKNTVYCLLFGGGDPKLAKTAKKPPGSGAELRKKLYQGLDGLGELMERLTKEWKSTAKQRYNAKYNRMEYFDGKIKGLDGRPIKIPSEHMLLVYMCQSDEAIHMALAYCLVNRLLSEKYKWGKDYGVVCWYHDEFTVECREEIAEDVKSISEYAIAEAGRMLNILCPHEGGGAIGKNWYDIH